MSTAAPQGAKPAKEPLKVIVYTKPDCSDCFNAKRFLNNREIPFEARGITDPQVMEELLALLGPGQYATPIIVLGEHVFVGFGDNRRHIENVLEQMTR